MGLNSVMFEKHSIVYRIIHSCYYLNVMRVISQKLVLGQILFLYCLNGTSTHLKPFKNILHADDNNSLWIRRHVEGLFETVSVIAIKLNNNGLYIDVWQ